MNSNWKRLLRGIVRSHEFGWYLSLILLLPTLMLAVLGIYFLITTDALLAFLLIWSLFTVLLGGWFYFRQRSNARDSQHGLSSDQIPSLQPAPEWSPQDHAAWQQALTFIDENVTANTPWINLRDLAIEQHTLLASHYVPAQKNHQLSFTLPEVLLMLEVTSSRYREFIREHIPFAESIQLATVKTLYDQRDNARKGYRVINAARRLLRLTNPLAAASSELRDHISGKVLGSAGHKLSLELKRALLQELAQVAIDLYSGRLKVSDAELSAYVTKASRVDHQHQAKPLEPLRVVVAGQVNAGKSTLINALCGNDATGDALTTIAETDLLPSTDAVTHYPWTLSADSPVLFVDTPGLDGSEQSYKLVLEQARTADVLVWVCKANQVARPEDVKALSKLKHWFAEHTDRIPPSMLFVITHCDQLRPLDEWNPPYSLNTVECSTGASAAAVKQCNIVSALAAVKKALSTDPETPVIAAGLPPGRARFNLTEVISALERSVGRASNTQLNRRRVESAAASIPWKSRLRQTKSLIGHALRRLR